REIPAILSGCHWRFAQTRWQSESSDKGDRPCSASPLSGPAISARLSPGCSPIQATTWSPWPTARPPRPPPIPAPASPRRFDALHDVRLRVGALPTYPSNALNYNLTWSTDGLINEYCEPCEAIVDGQLCSTAALEECEAFALDGVTYEAFNTSGGLGTLCETLAGKVRSLNYRTIRYPGHAAIMKVLLNDLRLRDRRDVLKDILEHALPATLQDVVIVFVTVSGLQAGRLVQETYANKIYAQDQGGRLLSAIQITTASGICAVLDLLVQGRLPQAGLVLQEEIALADFLANRFGRVYAQGAVAGRA